MSCKGITAHPVIISGLLYEWIEWQLVNILIITCSSHVNNYKEHPVMQKSCCRLWSHLLLFPVNCIFKKIFKCGQSLSTVLLYNVLVMLEWAGEDKSRSVLMLSSALELNSRVFDRSTAACVLAWEIFPLYALVMESLTKVVAAILAKRQNAQGHQTYILSKWCLLYVNTILTSTKYLQLLLHC